MQTFCAYFVIVLGLFSLRNFLIRSPRSKPEDCVLSQLARIKAGEITIFDTKTYYYREFHLFILLYEFQYISYTLTDIFGKKSTIFTGPHIQYLGA